MSIISDIATRCADAFNRIRLVSLLRMSTNAAYEQLETMLSLKYLLTIDSARDNISLYEELTQLVKQEKQMLSKVLSPKSEAAKSPQPSDRPSTWLALILRKQASKLLAAITTVIAIILIYPILTLFIFPYYTLHNLYNQENYLSKADMPNRLSLYPALVLINTWIKSALILSPLLIWGEEEGESPLIRLCYERAKHFYNSVLENWGSLILLTLVVATLLLAMFPPAFLALYSKPVLTATTWTTSCGLFAEAVSCFLLMPATLATLTACASLMITLFAVNACYDRYLSYRENKEWSKKMTKIIAPKIDELFKNYEQHPNRTQRTPIRTLILQSKPVETLSVTSATSDSKDNRVNHYSHAASMGRIGVLKETKDPNATAPVRYSPPSRRHQSPFSP